MSAQPDLFAHFHNTVKLSGSGLVHAKSRAMTQESLILAWFKLHPGLPLTPEQASVALPARVPLTSVRRAISDLTHAGKLRKTTRMTEGKYGLPIHYWELA